MTDEALEYAPGDVVKLISAMFELLQGRDSYAEIPTLAPAIGAVHQADAYGRAIAQPGHHFLTALQGLFAESTRHQAMGDIRGVMHNNARRHAQGGAAAIIGRVVGVL
jgi:hypothetical protein